MSLRELFTSPPASFLSTERGLEEAEWVFLGVPLDLTSTFRPGARYGPGAVREASLGLEIGSLLTGSRLDRLAVCDAGDLHVSHDLAETLGRLASVSSELLGAGKKLAVVGGEHTVTLGVVSGLEKALGKPKVVIFDAHLDLRDEFQGLRTCHATVGRRLVELLGPDRIAFLGARVGSEEELEFVRREGLTVLTSRQLEERGPSSILKSLSGLLGLEGPLHISLDLDVLDPAFAPAVQSPEPFGLDPKTLLGILLPLCREGPASLDVVEITPIFDSGQTALLAARLLAEAMWAGSHHA
ncbi:agmatinase [Candidatus Bathyarchaeota archaeon]|nr:MAG: agmatinase [Candidatus Bathyarchaeota archaeon]